MRAPGSTLPVLVAGLLLAAAVGARAQDDAAAGDPADAAAAAAALPDNGDEPMPRVATSPAATWGGTSDELVLERTEITGNRELPKVLYIVPWQKSDPGALVGRPANTLLDEVLAPLDREEFIRQVDYYSDLYGESGSPVRRAPTGPASPPDQSTEARAAGE